MASVVIHMAIASELDKKLKRKNHNELMLGAIAPDIAKLIGEGRFKAHFIQDEELGSPELNSFVRKYKNKMDNDFVLGYFIHLYTDYLWEKYFLTDFDYKNAIKYNKSMFLTNETGFILNSDEFNKFLYNDYTNLNVTLLDEYDLDLSLFYEPLTLPKVGVDEIPMERLKELVDYSSVIIENSKQRKSYLFDISEVKRFIDLSVDLIYSDILTLIYEELKV